MTRAIYGEEFFVSSFPKYNVDSVPKLLAQFEKDRLTLPKKGVYVKATKMRFGLLYPTTFESVNEISKRDKTKLISTGITAENRLGSSIQFPKNTCFLTSGSGRKLKIGNRMVTLLHGAPKNFAFKGRLMQEMVLALHSIGQNNITAEVKARIGQLLAEQQDNDTIAHDLLLASVWMRKLIERNRKKQL